MLASSPSPLVWPATILFVEDSKSIRTVISFLLQAEGIVVHSVETGLEALEALDALTPDVILLDLSLPDMDGFEVYATVRRRTTLLPIIFASGYSNIASRPEVTGDQLVRFLSKPYDFEVLLQALTELAVEASR